MDNNCAKGTTTTTDVKANGDKNKKVFVMGAQRKRMLLSEVYVHKARKLNSDSNPDNASGNSVDDDDHFDVFHIFELTDDPTTKITPKLSTNCTEPRKIIDVLRNSTGSDTPQLERLIEKLCAQKKWADSQKNQQNNPLTTVATAAVTAVEKTAKIADSALILDGRDHTYIKQPKSTPVVSTFPLAPTVSTAQTAPMASTSTVWTSNAPIPQITVRSATGTTTRYLTKVLRPSNLPTNPNVPVIRSIHAAPKQPNQANSAPKHPAIRVKTMENLLTESQRPTTSDNRPKLQAFAKKSVTVRPIARTMDGRNGVYQLKDKQYKLQTNQTIRTLNGGVTVASSTPSPVISTVSSATMKRTQPNCVQQPVKLWNNMMSSAISEPLKIHVSVKTRNQAAEINNATFPMQSSIQEGSVENDGNDGASMLKIGQVFEGVNQDLCADDLFLEQNIVPMEQLSTPSPPPPSSSVKPIQSPSPLLDTLVNEIENDQSTTTTTVIAADDDNDDSKIVQVVQNDDKSCADYRCNICLTFNDSIQTYRDHMLIKHGCRVICERCHDAFTHQPAFLNHLKDLSGNVMKCSLSANANRTYICIVEPPIILMRNEKVFAFRCKYCEDLAFQTQRNYVQHAQRHAKVFRCKQCPTKPLPIDLMREHLTHHKN